VDGTNVAVLDGLKAGDRVVTDGADRLRDGAKVTVPNAPEGNAAAPGQTDDQPRTRRRRPQQ
jgi:multidrug efflux pump subunit AcrA (membrane-fusion protein)